MKTAEEMKREELIAEARRLKKKADEIEFFISGLTGERQQIAVAELSSKVRDLRSLQKSFEELIEPLPPAEGAEYNDGVSYGIHVCDAEFHALVQDTFEKFDRLGKINKSDVQSILGELDASSLGDNINPNLCFAEPQPTAEGAEERLKNAPKNCPKAAQCAHVEGGMKCPPNVICPI